MTRRRETKNPARGGDFCKWEEDYFFFFVAFFLAAFLTVFFTVFLAAFFFAAIVLIRIITLVSALL